MSSGRKTKGTKHRERAAAICSISDGAHANTEAAGSASCSPTNTLSSQAGSSCSPSTQEPVSHSCRRAAALEDGQEAVLNFLLSLEQPLPQLLPVLCARGVQDGESLRALARTSDKIDWMVRALPEVRSLQQSFILNGLNRLAQA